MAESQKRDCSSVSTKEKNLLLDLDIGKDFFSSWKSMSIAEGDVMDFDLTPVSKGNKKSFEFDKADMDFNLDGDFGKMSSFNMDMSDLDISPPLKKDGKPKEKSKESSSGKDKGKTDRFAFAFDFDELENFSFESSLTKEGSKAQRDKNENQSSPNGSGCQDKEGSTHMNLIGSMRSLEDGPPKPSLPGTTVTFDMDSLVGGSVDLEAIKKNCPSNLAMDDAVTSEHSTAIHEVASDKAKFYPETTIASRELPKISQSEKLVFPEPVDLEACTGNDAVKDLSSDSLSNNEPTGGNSSEAQDKVEFMATNAIGSNGEQDVNLISIAGTTCNYKHIISENSHLLQTVAISEKNNGEKSQVGVDDPVVDNRERTELGQVKSFFANSCTTSVGSGILGDTPSGRENQEPASEILKFPLVSQPADLSENRREPLVSCSRSFIQSEKPECPVLEASTQTTLLSLSSKKMGFTQPSLVRSAMLII
ncbi:hypothetical protein Pfo_000865 [Paulownia fortunei]|nr:hypothetical protein Pfo_000865 [Paulownia fortunei]